MTRTKKAIGVFGLLITLMAVFFIATYEPKAKSPVGVRSEDAVAWLGENQFHEPSIRLGMSKEEVARLVPPPHNSDTEKVWIWCQGFPRSCKKDESRDWYYLYYEKGSGFFLVFKDGKLATQLCSTTAFDLWGALEGYSKLTLQEAEKVLGKKRPDPTGHRY